MTNFIWSNGCSNQFKYKVARFSLARYPLLTYGCTCMWIFFGNGNGNGNGPHNGAGVVVKMYVQKTQLDVSGP